MSISMATITEDSNNLQPPPPAVAPPPPPALAPPQQQSQQQSSTIPQYPEVTISLQDNRCYFFVLLFTSDYFIM